MRAGVEVATVQLPAQDAALGTLCTTGQTESLAIMATSEMSKSSGHAGAAPAACVCPKLAGTVAVGVVLLGAIVLALIPRQDYSGSLVAGTGLPGTPEPDLSTPSPSLPSTGGLTTDQTDTARLPFQESRPSGPDLGDRPASDETPSATPDSESQVSVLTSNVDLVSNETMPEAPRIPATTADPVVEPEGNDTSSAAPESQSPEVAAVPEPEEAIDEGPEVHANVLRVLEGLCTHPISGERFSFHDSANKSFVVKLAGIVAPKSGLDSFLAGHELGGKVRGKKVLVESVAEIDNKKTLVAWVTVDGESINEFMVRSGRAWYDPRTTTSPRLEKLQARARAAGVGIWSGGDVKPPFDEASPPSDEPAPGSTSAVESDNRPADSPQEVGKDSSDGGAKAPVKPADDKMPAEGAQVPVVVEQSPSEKLVTKFIEALKQNDLETARGLIGGYPIGFARRFRSGKLSDSDVDNLREVFGGASIQGTRDSSKNNIVAVLLKTASGKNTQIATRQHKGVWVIFTWNLPR